MFNDVSQTSVEHKPILWMLYTYVNDVSQTSVEHKPIICQASISLTFQMTLAGEKFQSKTCLAAGIQTKGFPDLSSSHTYTLSLLT